MSKQTKNELKSFDLARFFVHLDKSAWKQFTILIRSKSGAKAVHIPTLIFKDFRVLFFSEMMFTESY